MASPKVVLVTGSSDGGIGAEMCAAFHRAGCRVFASARKLDSMKALEVLGCELVQLDVCDQTSIEKCVEHVVAKAGRIDILVNNAGRGLIGPTMDVPVDKVRELFETNVYGVIAVSQAVFPTMANQRSGTIANVGSIAGWLTTPWGAAYCASKAAIESFTDGLRLEMKPFGIDVILIQPGAIKSNIGKNNAEHIYLNERGPYAPFADAIRARATLSQSTGPTPTNVFAEQAVATILKPKPPAHWFGGSMAWMVYIVSHFFPYWLQDFFVARRFQLNTKLNPELGEGKKTR